MHRRRSSIRRSIYANYRKSSQKYLVIKTGRKSKFEAVIFEDISQNYDETIVKKSEWLWELT